MLQSKMNYKKEIDLKNEKGSMHIKKKQPANEKPKNY